MKKTKIWGAALPGTARLLPLCACQKQPKTITVENETGYVIGDLRMAAVYCSEWGPNRLEDALPDAEYAVIALGDYTKDELSDGYSIQLFDDNDDSFAAADGILVEPGDTLTLSLADGTLAWSLDGTYYLDDDFEETESWDEPDAEPAMGSDAEAESDWLSAQPAAMTIEEYRDISSGMRMTYPSDMAAWTQDNAIFVAGSGCGVTVRDKEAAYNQAPVPMRTFCIPCRRIT